MIQGEQDQIIVLSNSIKLQESFVKEVIRLMSNVDAHGRLCIMINKWKELRLNQVCPYVQQWLITIAMFEYNFYSDILQNMRFIHFPRLIKLFLRSNNIYSLESINNLDMPVLKDLWLGFNNIQSISSLRKCNLSELQSLTLCSNKIQEFSIITMMHCPKLKQLDLSRSQDKNNFFNFSTLAKIQSASPIFKVWQLKNGIIRQNFVLENLKQKFVIQCSFYS